jgi:hypothetical protein
MSIGSIRAGKARDIKKNRYVGAGLLQILAGRCRNVRLHLAKMIGRGDRDYEKLSVLSQEIGRIRQEVRQDLERRRADRQRKQR